MTPYEEPGSPTDLHADCAAVRRSLDDAAAKALRPAPSIHFDEFPREVPKRGIEISEAAQRLAAAIFDD